MLFQCWKNMFFNSKLFALIAGQTNCFKSFQLLIFSVRKLYDSLLRDSFFQIPFEHHEELKPKLIEYDFILFGDVLDFSQLIEKLGDIRFGQIKFLFILIEFINKLT